MKKLHLITIVIEGGLVTVYSPFNLPDVRIIDLDQQEDADQKDSDEKLVDELRKTQVELG